MTTDGLSIRNSNLMRSIFDRYTRDVIPSKAPRAQRDNQKELAHLRKVLDEAPIDALTPAMIARYRDTRKAKVRANRGIATLSHVFNMAREWGLTANQNPCKDVRKNKETPRDYYANDALWQAVYRCAVPELKDAMDLAYLTGQRPADVLVMRRDDIEGDFLLVQQGETAMKLRLLIRSGGQDNSLGTLIRQMDMRHEGHLSPYLIATEKGHRVTASMLRIRFDEARAATAKVALENLDETLAAAVRTFQFRDIRPKAASEIDDPGRASKLLGHIDKRITETVYRRVGEVVEPTK